MALGADTQIHTHIHDMYSLFCRRQHGDLIEVFKILNGYYNVDATYFLHHLSPALEVTI